MVEENDGKIKVAFFGSSEFSIPTLKKLLNTSNIDVVAVITASAVRKNRGKKIANNVVYDFAVNAGFNVNDVFTPNKLKNNREIVDVLMQKNTDFIVVVSYGKIIPKAIIDVPRYEIINLHPSALPRFRGAAPIERAIESGDEETEICIMKVDEGLDTGDVLIRQKYVIGKTKHASEIVPEIAEIGADLIIQAINDVKNNQLFCGYASVFNVLDNHNDIILPNAICNIDSIKNIPILWQHDVKKPVGKVIDAYIDDIGLFIYADINQELIYGKEAYSSLKSNTVNGLSIGYKINKNYIKDNIGYLEDIKIIEISIVSLPANEMSMAELL